MTDGDTDAGDSSQQASRLWADMRRRRERGEAVRVEDYFSDPAIPKDDPDLLLDLVYGEFVLRQQAGEVPSEAEYRQRFPQLGERLDRQLEFHRALASVSSPETLPGSIGGDPRDDIPERIGKYRIIARLGAGGQATAYRAVHPDLGQDVVLKVSHLALVPGSPESQRLVSEGRILAGLRHPGLARVFDLDLSEGRPFLVMEYVPGRSLEQAGRQERLPPREAARLVAALARAVAHAHARGVAHLDIKPGNVLLAEDGSPRLLDFGLSRSRSAWIDRPDDTTEVSGTLAYMAPERTTGAPGQSLERADLFGLGGVLYFLLAGQPPFCGKTSSEVWERVHAGEWERAPLEQPGIPEPLRRACRKCLATDPAGRYGSAQALAADLERFACGPLISRRAAIAGAGLLAAAGLASWLRFAAAGKPLLPPDPRLRLLVWNGQRYGDVIRHLPLETGDEVRLETERPAGFHAVLLWIDSDGIVHELLVAEAGAEMVYPASGHAVPIKGRPGTELILLCARRGGPVDIERLRDTLAGVRDWPALPGSSVLRLGRDGVTVENTGRGPGAARRRDDPEGEVAERLRQLGAELHERCEVLVGIAVSHR